MPATLCCVKNRRCEFVRNSFFSKTLQLETSYGKTCSLTSRFILSMYPQILFNVFNKSLGFSLTYYKIREREKKWLCEVNTSGKPSLIEAHKVKNPNWPRQTQARIQDKYWSISWERAPKAQGSIVGCGGILPQEISWISESFRQDIGQFHSPRITPYKSADFFISRLQLGEVFPIKKILLMKTLSWFP